MFMGLRLKKTESMNGLNTLKQKERVKNRNETNKPTHYLSFYAKIFLNRFYVLLYVIIFYI